MFFPCLSEHKTTNWNSLRANKKFSKFTGIEMSFIVNVEIKHIKLVTPKEVA